jgi:hypothetical protein
VPCVSSLSMRVMEDSLSGSMPYRHKPRVQQPMYACLPKLCSSPPVCCVQGLDVYLLARLQQLLFIHALAVTFSYSLDMILR